MDGTLRKHKGARNELIACCWLLSRGYEVFRNVSPHGLVDIIAKSSAELLFIDVKGAYYGKDGREVVASLSEEQLAAGIIPLFVFPDGNCTLDKGLASLLEKKRSCLSCGEVFRPTDRTHVYCSKSCRPSAYKRKKPKKGS